MVNASWAGAQSYAAAGWRIHASWGDEARIAPRPIQPPAQQVGAPAISQQLIIAPAGWLDSTPPAAHFAGREDEYGAAQYTLNASWYGAAPYAPPVWGINATWGSAQQVTPRTMAPPQDAVPTPFVTQAQRIGDAGGIAPPEVPEGHTVTDSSEYRPAYGRLDATWLGAPDYWPPLWRIAASWSAKLFIAPAGIAPAGVGQPAIVQQQRIAPQGWESGAIGDGSSALHPWQYAAPRWRLDASWVGAGEYTPPRWVLNASWTLPTGDIHIAPIGFDESAVGTPALPVVQPAGWEDAQQGWHTVANTAVVITAGGMRSTAAVGEPEVALRTRWIEDAGVAHETQWGRAEPPGTAPAVQWARGTFVSHFLRYVGGAGNASAGAAFGRAWASHSPRTIDLDLRGIEPGRVGWHTLGGEQGIFPEGWLDERFGERIVPDKQEVTPAGWESAEFGEARVWNWQQVIAPPGYAPWLNSPGVRWGVADVWNQTQYIFTDSTEHYSGLCPTEAQVSASALVLNRNRTIEVWGIPHTKFGYTYVALTGRVVAPAGIAPPDDAPWVKRQRVTHWQQRVAPESIEPWPLLRWHFVYNNARLLQPPSLEGGGFGTATLTKMRVYSKMQGWDSAEVGEGGMVDFRVRHITLDGKAPIIPPYNSGHEVGLLQRYIRPESIVTYWNGVIVDHSKMGVPDVVERFTRIMPRWNKQSDRFGLETLVKNLTPEIHQRGKEHTEFGDAFVRTQWREVQPYGECMTLFGRAHIGDRTKWIRFANAGNVPAIGRHTITRLGDDPPSTQIIDLRKYRFEGNVRVEAERGYGIDPPGGMTQNTQVPPPDLLYRSIFPNGFESGAFGQADVWSGNIEVRPGIGRLPFGDARVELKHRTIFPESLGQQVRDTDSPKGEGSFGVPSLSPHTIYVMGNPPPQAAKNHPSSTYFSAGSGERFGAVVIGGYNNTISPPSISRTGGMSYTPLLAWGTASVTMRKRSIKLEGWRVERFGAHMLNADQHIIFDEEDYAPPQETWGRARVGFPGQVGGDVDVRGWDSGAVGRHEVQNFHRALPLAGWDSMQMGYSRGQRYPYMPQSLRVGFPDWPAMQGWLDEAFGAKTWVSHRVREVKPHGWEQFECRHTAEDFDKRMRVWRTGDEPPTPPTPPAAAQEIRPHGFECGWRCGIPDISNKQQRVKAGVICPPTNQVSILAEVRHA